MTIDLLLIAEIERLKTGATVHWVNSTIYKYKNGSKAAEESLRTFVARNGKLVRATKEQLEHLWDRMKFPPERLPIVIAELTSEDYLNATYEPESPTTKDRLDP